MTVIILFAIPLLTAIFIGAAVFVAMNKLPISALAKKKKVLFACVFGLGGGIYVSIALLGLDNREKIAMALLYPDGVRTTQIHDFPSPALTGALNGKFPPGTNSQNLKSFVAKLGGRCHQVRSGQPVFCSISESGTFCVLHSLAITAKTDNLNQIERIEAHREFLAC